MNCGKYPGAGAQPPESGNAEYAEYAEYAKYGDFWPRAQVLYESARMNQDIFIVFISRISGGPHVSLSMGMQYICG